MKNGWTVEFAEKYQPDLELEATVDDFGRPAHTWTWKKAEIGTYVDYDKMVAEYTTKVTGEDLYDLLGKTAIEDNEVSSMWTARTDGTPLQRQHDRTKGRSRRDRQRRADPGVPGHRRGRITIAVINTYLAKAKRTMTRRTRTST